MCQFLTGENDVDRTKIRKLSAHLNAERHACDALFSALSEAKVNPTSQKISKATDLYSRIILARSTNDFSEIEDIAHQITGETV